MAEIKVAAVQMSCSRDITENIDKAERLVREAAGKGARIILLPELFERQYFCQERRYDYYGFAKPVSENDAVERLAKVSEELSVVIPVSIYERAGTVLYNTVVMLDCGKNLGIYRKTHIPDDHFYQEKFYFTPGNTGFKVFDTTYGRVGMGICWDQWFPETARSLALLGADIILYPTAIGSEPILGGDSSGHWMRTMQGHSAANIIPVAAANRYGTEEVTPSEENGGQKSSLKFYGTSFLTNETGEVIAKAGTDGEEILTAEYDFEKLRSVRLEWGVFRDRRPEMYGGLVQDVR
ncbi:MAG: N-carbamoylputrescine amidase [Lachnospiraceae bacterium]|nr:N-carbamoylputrescine amidase [Lachnospiraceae bacterium]